MPCADTFCFKRKRETELLTYSKYVYSVYILRLKDKCLEPTANIYNRVPTYLTWCSNRLNVHDYLSIYVRVLCSCISMYFLVDSLSATKFMKAQCICRH